MRISATLLAVPEDLKVLNQAAYALSASLSSSWGGKPSIQVLLLLASPHNPQRPIKGRLLQQLLAWSVGDISAVRLRAEAHKRTACQHVCTVNC